MMQFTLEELATLLGMVDSYVRLFEKEPTKDESLGIARSIRKKIIKELAKEIYFN